MRKRCKRRSGASRTPTKIALAAGGLFVFCLWPSKAAALENTALPALAAAKREIPQIKISQFKPPTQLLLPMGFQANLTEKPKVSDESSSRFSQKILLALFAFLAVAGLWFVSRRTSRTPKPDEAPSVPEGPLSESLLAVYRCNGQVAPPRDAADARARGEVLTSSIVYFALGPREANERLAALLEPAAPDKAVYFAALYFSPSGIRERDMLSGFLRRSETRRVLGAPDTELVRVVHFLTLPENAGFRSFN